MRVLVTGAGGMLGGAVARALAARGDDVVLMQRRPSGLSLPERLGDIADPEAVRHAVDGVDAVVHLAARVGVTGSWEQFVRSNVTGTANLLEAVRAAAVGRFVHVSSPSVAHAGAALVGAGAGPADPDRARGPYARSKAVAERLALSAAGPAVVAIRPHLVWGPGDTQLVGRIVERARSGRLALVGSAAALVDTTYVDNAVSALLAALDRAPTLAGQAYVVSNGEPRPIGELVARICAAAGVPAPSRHVSYRAARVGGAAVEAVWALLRRTDDPPMTRFLAEQLATAHWFDLRATKDALGWEPTVGLDEGFERLAASLRA